MNRSSAATVIYGGKNHQTSVVGTTNDYLIAQDWTIALGREFLPAEDRGGQIGCIIGETVRQELFGSSDPVGQTIRVSNISCPVIAVLGRKGQSGLGDDQDDTVIMPLKIHQRRIRRHDDDFLHHGLRPGRSLDCKSAVRPGKSAARAPAHRAWPPGRFHCQRHGADRVCHDRYHHPFDGLLGAVAAVSLLVGGIGIMNIMLVSVTERTREIGIRLAIGALEKQVLTQFLVEAVMLSAFGGTAGILTGLGLAYAVVSFLGVPFVTSPVIIAVAFAFSAAIGVVFGYFPARRAASLSPIEALRHE